MIVIKFHDDVIKWNHFPRYWPFVREIHRSPVNSPQKGQRRRALMFSLICAWINGWVNNREAGDLIRHHAHYDVIVMLPGRFTGIWNNIMIAPVPMKQSLKDTVKIYRTIPGAFCLSFMRFDNLKRLLTLPVSLPYIFRTQTWSRTYIVPGHQQAQCWLLILRVFFEICSFVDDFESAWLTGWRHLKWGSYQRLFHGVGNLWKLLFVIAYASFLPIYCVIYIFLFI